MFKCWGKGIGKAIFKFFQHKISQLVLQVDNGVYSFAEHIAIVEDENPISGLIFQAFKSIKSGTLFNLLLEYPTCRYMNEKRDS